jgi:uncharacterized ubiquitin-like protein YukD
MQRVIVTVECQERAKVLDLEVPSDVESKRLADMIAHALRWQVRSEGPQAEYEIKAEPPGRVLAPEETLAEAGVWDGAYLTIQFEGSEAGDVTTEEQSRCEKPDGDGVVKRWRPIGWPSEEDIDVPPQSEAAAETSTSTEGRFVWKQLD